MVGTFCQTAPCQRNPAPPVIRAIPCASLLKVFGIMRKANNFDSEAQEMGCGYWVSTRVCIQLLGSAITPL